MSTIMVDECWWRISDVFSLLMPACLVYGLSFKTHLSSKTVSHNRHLPPIVDYKYISHLQAATILPRCCQHLATIRIGQPLTTTNQSVDGGVQWVQCLRIWRRKWRDRGDPAPVYKVPPAAVSDPRARQGTSYTQHAFDIKMKKVTIAFPDSLCEIHRAATHKRWVYEKAIFKLIFSSYSRNQREESGMLA